MHIYIYPSSHLCDPTSHLAISLRMRLNPVNLLGLVLLLLALLGAWISRRDLARGETRWLGWARLAQPASRRDAPLRYWTAMGLNILLVILFALVGAFAMRAGLFRLGKI